MQVYVSQDGTLGANHKQYKTSGENVFDDAYKVFGFTFSDQDLRLYINGKEAALNKVSDGIVNTLYNPSSTPVALGCIFNSGNPANLLSGRLKKAVIFKKQLNNIQILDLYERLKTNSQEV
jgi:hypothetical protein